MRAQWVQVETELAARQHGLVTRAQLLARGLTRHAVSGDVRAGRLRPVHRGVYLYGPLVSPLSAPMAAVLACGDEAFVSHLTAADLWEVRRHRDALVDVSTRRDRGRRPNIRAHRVRALEPDEVTRLQGVPITTPARTLLDIAGLVSPRELEQACGLAERRHITTRIEIVTLLDRYPRRPGAPALRALIEDAPRGFTQSEAEERFLALIRAADLPRPELNAYVFGYRVDFLWRAEKFVVEVDGFAFHSSEREFETDRDRDGVLAARGVRVMRVTWRQILKRREALVTRVARALYAAGAERDVRARPVDGGAADSAHMAVRPGRARN